MSRKQLFLSLLLETALILCFVVFEATAHAWEVDLSRRRREITQSEAKHVDSKATDVEGIEEAVSKIAGNYERQEFVILNTAKGFVPSSVRVKKGNHYTVHVVNVNDSQKNVSFMLDAFAQNHATYYGKIRSFQLDPNKDGVFTFNCPETSSEGRLIVFSSSPATSVRGMASENK